MNHRQSGITAFEQVEEGTLLRFTARIEARFPLKLLLPLLVRLMRRQNDKSFAVLKRLLETYATSSVQDAV